MLNKSKTSILTIVDDLNRGGTQRCAQNYAVIYKKLGYDSRIATIKGGGVRKKKLLEHGVDVLAETKENTISAINALKPDIIHFHQVNLYEQTWTEVVATAVNSTAKVLRTNVFAKPDYTSFGRKVDVELHLSEWCFNKWKRWNVHGNKGPLGIVAPYIMDEEKFLQGNDSTLIENDKNTPKIPEGFIFGRVGQPLAEKWDFDAFAIFNAFAKNYSDVYFLAIGCPEIYKNRTKLLDKSDRFIFMDPVDDDALLHKIYKKLDVFFHSSKLGESFGMVLLEAAIADVPIITKENLYRDNTQAELVAKHKLGNVYWCQKSGLKLLEEMYTKKREMISCKEEIITSFGHARGCEMLKNIIEIVLNNDKANYREKFSEAGFITEDNLMDFKDIALLYGKKLKIHEKVILEFIHNRNIYRSYLYFKKLVKTFKNNTK